MVCVSQGRCVTAVLCVIGPVSQAHCMVCVTGPLCHRGSMCHRAVVS